MDDKANGGDNEDKSLCQTQESEFLLKGYEQSLDGSKQISDISKLGF